MITQKRFSFLLVGIILFSTAIYYTEWTYAQDEDDHDSIILFEYYEPFEENWALNQPALVSTIDGRTHLFWSVAPIENSAVYHMDLVDGRWSNPVDVLIGSNQSQSNSSVSAEIDPDGIIHAIWHNGGLFYSSAQDDMADTAQGWSEPQEIVARVSSSRLFADQNGKLHIVFVSLKDVTTLYYMHCVASSCVWSNPEAVAYATGQTAILLPNLWTSPQGTIHVVWGEAELPDGWPPTAVYYAQSNNEGFSWSPPQQMASGSIGNPAIIGVNEEELHMVWLGSTEGGRFYSQSKDGGQTWSVPEQFTPSLGGMLVGYVKLLLDSSNNVHLFVEGSNIPSHSWWNGSSWSSFEPIGRGESAMATITNGNQMHLVWLNPSTLHYTTRELEQATYVGNPTLRTETEVHETTKETIPTTITPLSPTPQSTFAAPEQSTNRLSSFPSGGPLLFGIGSSFLLIIASVAFLVVRKRKSQL